MMPAYYLLLVSCFIAAYALDTRPFPGSNGKNIGYALPGIDVFQPSDLVWHKRLQRLFVVSDRGYLGSLKDDGSDFQYWKVSYLDWGRLDLEGVTVASYDSNFIYLGVEAPASVLEWDLTTHKVTRMFNLTEDMGTSKSSGLEALTFVPDSGSEGGLFYTGKQKTGAIYKYRLSILSSNTSTKATFLKKTKSNITDISGMDYNRNTNTFYMIYDVDNLMAKVSADGNTTEYYVLDGEEQEGIAFSDDAKTFFVAWDGGPCADAETLFGYQVGLVLFIVFAVLGSMGFICTAQRLRPSPYREVNIDDFGTQSDSWRARLRRYSVTDVAIVFAIILASAAISSGLGVGYGSFKADSCGQIWKYDWSA